MTNDEDRNIRVLLADDHMVVRMGIASVLTLGGGIEAVGTSTRAEAVSLAISFGLISG